MTAEEAAEVSAALAASPGGGHDRLRDKQLMLHKELDEWMLLPDRALKQWCSGCERMAELSANGIVVTGGLQEMHEETLLQALSGTDGTARLVAALNAAGARHFPAAWKPH
eukprot:CAMPEP_0172168308 /NCGR_PEP_ID=MMETSP1050-20130122/10061_1 /TAXON_ID=233186 /ORGANISM="Cryptomonas curvata, Strain CCAP979/52" /LENGTH=110 /DNA_ID=CAMNT_0012839207 /DNA_START=20 /DNA_END=352 /DNA_ORIENTATION=+